MKALIISVFPPTRLAEADHAYHLCSQLAEDGVEVHVLTQKGSIIPARPNLHVHPMMRYWSWQDVPRMAACLRRVKPDVVLILYVGHMYNFQASMTFCATLAKRLLPGKPVITMFEHIAGLPIKERDFKGLLQRGFYKIIRSSLGWQVTYSHGTLLCDSDRIVALTGAHVRYFKRLFPDVEAKAVVVPPPALLLLSPPEDAEARTRQREALGVKPDETLLVYFGYVYHNKGIETLLSAMEIVCRERPDVHLMLVGGTVQASSDHSPGYAQEMQRFAESLECRDNIHFTGGYEWDSDQASQRLRAADIAVLPFDAGVQMNNSSVAGVVTHGLPLITTQPEFLDAQFVQECNVLLVPPKDPDALATAINRVVGDEALRETLRKGADELADDWFSLSASAGRVLAVLDEARSERHTGHTVKPIVAHP